VVLFLRREVLSIDLPWLNNIGRPQQIKRIPSVLTKDEVAGLLAQMDGINALLAHLLYGTGMQLMEGMRLRVKDVDFDRHAVIVREAKGNKDRVVMLPRSLCCPVHWHPRCACKYWQPAHYGKQTGRRNAAALRYRMRWTSNTPRWAPLGHGFGCFLRQRCQQTRAVALSAGTICLKSVCSAP
jgi:integrase